MTYSDWMASRIADLRREWLRTQIIDSLEQFIAMAALAKSAAESWPTTEGWFPFGPDEDDLRREREQQAGCRDSLRRDMAYFGHHEKRLLKFLREYRDLGGDLRSFPLLYAWREKLAKEAQA